MKCISERPGFTPTHADERNLDDRQNLFARVESKALVSSVGTKQEQPGRPNIRIVGSVLLPELLNVPKHHIGLTDETLSSVTFFHELPEILGETNPKHLFSTRDLLIGSPWVCTEPGEEICHALAQRPGFYRRQGAQSLYCSRHYIQHIIDIFRRRRLQQAEAQAGAGSGFVETHGH